MRHGIIPPAILGDRILSRGAVEAPYRLRLARGPEEVRAAQTLRFLVFNLELNEGLEESYRTCLDADPFDAVCDHLIVEATGTGDVVGTYRLQTGKRAAEGLGYYSAQEFDFAPFESVRSQMIELGRACVHSQHRNLSVLGLLWRGIAEYSRERGARYLIGCSSLTSQDPLEGAAMYRQLRCNYLSPEAFRTVPMPGWGCPLDGEEGGSVKVPKLLRAYLSLGARICGPPALDREFRTIDFLTLLDLDSLPASIVARTLA